MRNPKAIPLLVWILAALAGCGPDERAEDGEDPSAPRDPAPMLAVHEAPLVATLPAGFEEVVVLTGLAQPSAIAFSPDGRVFVAEKSGLVKVFPSLGSTQPTVFADLRTQVHNFWDRGLLGLALHPNFPATPWVYVLYTRDAQIGGTAPLWGTAGADSDGCPNPPGATATGCTVSARLSRFTASGNVAGGPETVLIENWCQQFPSHSIGTIAFGRDGALYVSAGEGANFNTADYGQSGNTCQDPPSATLSASTSQGGAFRSQNLGMAGYSRVTYDGKILRVDPATGNALPDNPLAGSAVPGQDRMVARGLRNPFRFTTRPGTDELWIGDVGWSAYEEIDRVADPRAGVANLGWPCYEGSDRRTSYETLGNVACANLYANPSTVAFPYFAYAHQAAVVAGDGCATGSSSVSGLAFYSGAGYPAAYRDALFFADYSRNCIWVMRAGANGLPDPATRAVFARDASGPIQLVAGPGGDLFYVDFLTGTVRRIRAVGANQAPAAVADATPTSGPVPLAVRFDASRSTDPEGGALAYSWDLDGNGTLGDSTAASPTFTYATAGTRAVTLRVTDPLGAASTAQVTIVAGRSPPVPTIATPASTLAWAVGDPVAFSGSATDSADGTLPASALAWSLVLQHCPSTCHAHPIQSWPGVASGAFTAPDHEYPSYLELTLTARNSAGLTASTTVRLDPRTVDLTLASSPAGLALALGGATAPAPFTRRVVAGSRNSLGAASPQSLAGTTYVFRDWSDGGAAAHDIVAPAASATWTATFVPGTGGTLPAPWQTADVGAVAAAGSATVSGTTVAVGGSGADIWGTADEFRFVYQPLAGDGEVVARVATQQNTNAWAKAGVMVRESLAANARHASMFVTPTNGTAFQRRSTVGNASGSTTGPVAKAPTWVRVVRTGSTLTGAVSADGVAWTTVGSTVIALPSTVLVGLAVTSHADGIVGNVTFDGVRPALSGGDGGGGGGGGGTLPAPWLTGDVGAVAAAGSATLSGTTFTVRGSGADIWGTADEFRFAYRPLTGDGQVVARVASQQNTNAWAKAGVMIRASLDPGAQYAAMLVTPSNGAAFQRRSTAGNYTGSTARAGVAAPRWVRVVRSGSTLAGYVSADGVAWSLVGTTSIALPATVQVGLAVSSHADGTLGTATFDGVGVP